jgi:hypothetical protein
LIVVVTDGQSANIQATRDAADAARNEGSTVAVITLGPAENFNDLEIEYIVDFDDRLQFSVEVWAELNNDAAFVQNVTSVACDVPITIPITNNTDFENVTTPIVCEDTRYFTFPATVSEPLTLSVTISFGNVLVCYSYVNDQPTNMSSIMSPTADFCSLAGAGTTNFATVSAYPPVFNATLGPRPVYSSVTPLLGINPGSGLAECGGVVSLRGFHCPFKSL